MGFVQFVASVQEGQITSAENSPQRARSRDVILTRRQQLNCVVNIFKTEWTHVPPVLILHTRVNVVPIPFSFPWFSLHDTRHITGCDCNYHTP